MPAIVATPAGFTVEGASPELLLDLLDRFADVTARLGAPIDDYLQPGISAAQVEDALGAIGLVPPAELVAWWGWRNGVIPGRELPVSLDLRPLEMTMVLYERQLFGTSRWEWHRSWIPILGNHPDGIAVDCSAPPNEPPLVRAVSGYVGTHPDDTKHQVVSLCTPVAWWLIARERGWTRLARDGGFWEPERGSFPPEWWEVELAHS